MKIRYCSLCRTARPHTEHRDPPPKKVTRLRCTGCGLETVAYDLSRRPWAGV